MKSAKHSHEFCGLIEYDFSIYIQFDKSKTPGPLVAICKIIFIKYYDLNSKY